jgi:hypothetical protein
MSYGAAFFTAYCNDIENDISESEFMLSAPSALKKMNLYSS